MFTTNEYITRYYFFKESGYSPLPSIAKLSIINFILELNIDLHVFQHP